MNNGDKVYLGEIADLQVGFPFKSKEYSESPDAVKLVRGDNVVQGSFRWENVKRIEIGSVPPEVIQKYSLAPHDVILAMDRPWISAGLKYCSVSQDDLPCLLVQRVCRLRAKENLDQRFLKYVIGSDEFTAHIRNVETGTAVPHISQSSIGEFLVKLPPMHDQKAIAHILGTLDDKIELNQKMNQTLEDIVKAIFKSWFVDFDPVRAKMEERPTGLPPEIDELFPDELVDSEIGEIPKGWEVAPLEECAIEIESGRRPKGGIDKSLQQGIPSVGAESIAPAGEFDFSKVKYVTAEFAQKMKKGRVQNFDIALYKDGGKPGQFIPRVGIYGDGFPFDHFYVNEHVFLLRSEQLGQPFLYRLVSSLAFLDQLIAKGSAKAAQPGLNQTEVVESSFVCPNEDAITVFNNKTRPLLERQFLLGKENEILSELRDTLLPKLISGELRIPDAEKLLEEADI